MPKIYPSKAVSDMARYIDADKLVEMYERSAKDDWNKKTAPSSWADAYDCIIADIDDQPTANVAPKSEVAREIIDEFMSAMRVKHEENRPKYGGALALLLPDIEQIAAELKKKYTEGKT
jgi:hypothetical protein